MPVFWYPWRFSTKINWFLGLVQPWKIIKIKQLDLSSQILSFYTSCPVARNLLRHISGRVDKGPPHLGFWWWILWDVWIVLPCLSKQLSTIRNEHQNGRLQDEIFLRQMLLLPRVSHKPFEFGSFMNSFCFHWAKIPSKQLCRQACQSTRGHRAAEKWLGHSLFSSESGRSKG